MANYISNTMYWIGFSYPAGGMLCTIVILIYYHAVPLDKKKIVD